MKPSRSKLAASLRLPHLELVPNPEPGHELESWTAALGQRDFRRDLAVSAIGLPLLVFSYTRFLLYVEGRPGVQLPDPVLSWLPSTDLSWISFGILYLSIGWLMVTIYHRPRLLIQGFRAYCWMIALRMLVMAVLPLDPPAGMIVLRDPLMELLMTSNQVLSRDLFFSGHVATVSLVFLHSRTPTQRRVMLGAIVAVSLCVLVQHVHYTIDVLCAPVFAWLSQHLVWRTRPSR